MSVQELLNLSRDAGLFYSENLEDELNDILNDLVNKIEKFIKEKSVENGTVLNNSVYKSIIPFSYKTRVKSNISIEEKIIRNDIRLEEINKESLLKKFDDLIGITILTTTIGFQNIAFDYLKTFLDINKDEINVVSGLDNKKTIFDNENIEYYHIKLTYNSYPVEIQIKSIFLNAFADIEHTLFYKDHEIHELKNYNKKILHSLAPMLINIEEILHDIYTYDVSYITIETLRTQIYSYVESRTSDIFGVTNESGKLSFIINQISQIICSYFIERNLEFDENFFESGMVESQDKKIIDYFYKDSLLYSAVSKLMNDDSNFFKNIILFELKTIEKNREKIEIFSKKIDVLLEIMLYISENEMFKNISIKRKLRLLDLYRYFEDIYDDYIDEFEEQIKEFVEDDDQKKSLEKFINSSLILKKIVSEDQESIALNEIVEKWIARKEEESIIELTTGEKVSQYILERWNR